MSILDKLAAHARERVLADSENMSLDILQAMCREKGRANGARFYDALKKDDLSFICEVKKASPSKGVIARDFPYLDIARDYEAAGADCISCLTEPKWFLGSDDIFREIRTAVSTPMLRKDFTVSDYQLYQSRLMGADCVLLICALLDTKRSRNISPSATNSVSPRSWRRTTRTRSAPPSRRARRSSASTTAI